MYKISQNENNSVPRLAWITDPNTGKQYADLEKNIDRDNARVLCRRFGGMLPEPRHQEENDFLNSWQTDTFYLGMSDTAVEGNWVWDSDLTDVSWEHWRPNTAEPDGGEDQNFAVMSRNLVPNQAEYWSSVVGSINKENTVICEKIRKYINYHLIPPPPNTHI